ncbi:helix-turn-helix transcriptional regulator [Acidovorax sp. SDU_ACID1]|uniref:helix-turn-helix transcriptional regulator n=1 Tax=Acidovorax sp. SDU_ACID1 TaxID=3136632 RepID=UPI00387382B6
MDLIMPTSTFPNGFTAYDKVVYDDNGTMPSLPETGFVRQKLLLRFVPFSKSTLWRHVATGLFPAPVKLSDGVTAWRVEEVRQWIDGRPRIKSS